MVVAGARVTLAGVRRLVRPLIALLLVFGLSGAASLVAAEPCTSAESSAADDDCSPTCVTCGCCHQAHEVTALVVTLAPGEPLDVETAPRVLLLSAQRASTFSLTVR